MYTLSQDDMNERGFSRVNGMGRSVGLKSKRKVDLVFARNPKTSTVIEWKMLGKEGRVVDNYQGR